MSLTKEEFLIQFTKMTDGQLIDKVTFSCPIDATHPKRIDIRRIEIKQETHYQITEQKQNQAFHTNVSKQQLLDFLIDAIFNYKETHFSINEVEYHILVSKKGSVTLLKKKTQKSVLNLSHNRKKEYLLPEGLPVPFLVELGIMHPNGTLIPKKTDKFRQINRFIEMIDDILVHFDSTKKLNIIDFGCGKAYLTFALYHYIHIIKRFDVKIVGLDLKADVIEKCQALSVKLGYSEQLSFQLGDINEYLPVDKVDLVVTLHACDTATDAAIEKSIRWNTKVILSVPCCQHELFSQLSNSHLAPLLNHGILKERFSALVTDTARAQLLEALGYRTQIIEFIDMEHTPKNILIRAVKREKNDLAVQKKAWKEYLEFKEELKITPSLEKRFLAELQAL